MGLLSELKARGIDGDTALRGIMRGLRPVTSYGDLQASDAEDGLMIGRIPDQPPIICMGFGRIVDEGPTGEADYTDARYWIEMVAVRKGTDNPDSTANFVREGEPTDDDGSTFTIPVTNAAEVAKSPSSASTSVKGCHLLDVGTMVVVYCVEDDAARERYIIDKRPDPVSVRIDSDTGCGNGAYNGKVIRRPTADIAKATNVTSPSFGVDGPTCIVLNSAEIGVADHWLTDAANTNQDTFFGKLLYVNSDGTPVIAINAAWFKVC